ncbi:MAG: hypothetical protein AAF799_45215 [Myxococcota bacterium]
MLARSATPARTGEAHAKSPAPRVGAPEHETVASDHAPPGSLPISHDLSRVSVSSRPSGPGRGYQSVTRRAPPIMRGPSAAPIQGVFENASGVRRLGGTTDGAFRVDTPGEDPRVLKVVRDDFSVKASQLGRRLGINTPEVTQVPIEDARGVLDRFKQRAPGAGRPVAVSQPLIQGQTARGRRGGPFSERELQQTGHIAAFDMMIGKTDLFENFEQNNDEQENFDNVMFSGGNVHDIDLDAGIFGERDNARRLSILDEIARNPTQVHPFVKRKVGGLLERDDDLSMLHVQRGMMQFVANAAPNQEEAQGLVDGDSDKERGTRTMLGAFAERSETAGNAVETLNAEIERQTREREERQRQRRLEREAAPARRPAAAPARRQRNRGRRNRGCCTVM